MKILLVPEPAAPYGEDGFCREFAARAAAHGHQIMNGTVPAGAPEEVLPRLLAGGFARDVDAVLINGYQAPAIRAARAAGTKCAVRLIESFAHVPESLMTPIRDSLRQADCLLVPSQYLARLIHSWNGGTVEQYTHFSQAARKLDVPLLVGEGGLDPSAHQYRAIFLEPWFCLNEIAQYVEIYRVAQPLSILHWQLTADYSVLTGGNGGRPLQPAARFWQIKQLGMTAPDSKALPITCDNPKVVSCAFADHGGCVVHLINRGATRTVTVSGLPADLKEMRVLVTDGRRGMQESTRVPVVQGTLQMPLDAMSFTSLAGNP